MRPLSVTSECPTAHQPQATTLTTRQFDLPCAPDGYAHSFPRRILLLVLLLLSLLSTQCSGSSRRNQRSSRQAAAAPVALNADGCTHYASPSVNSASGLSGLTIEQAVSLPDARDMATPGTIVCLLGGEYALAETLRFNRGGTAERWIVYRSHDAANPAVIQPGPAFDNRKGVALFAFQFGDSHYIEINGLYFDGNGPEEVTLDTTNYNIANAALSCLGSLRRGYSHHLRFLNNVIRNTGSAGISTKRCDYITAVGNRIHHNGYSKGWSSGISYNSHVWLSEDGSWLLGEEYAGFHSFIIGNIISGQVDCCGRDGTGTRITDGTGIIIDLANNNSTTPPVLIANNLVYQNGGKCIATRSTTNNWIINNTCYSNTLDTRYPRPQAELHNSGASYNYYINNIVYTWPRGYTATQREDEFKLRSFTPVGFYYRNMEYGGLGQQNLALTEAEMHSADPRFVNPPSVNQDPVAAPDQYEQALDPLQVTDHFHLQPDSPAIDAGVDPRTIAGQIVLQSGATLDDVSILHGDMAHYLLSDLAGNPRPPDGQDWDLGAYEHPTP